MKTLVIASRNAHKVCEIRAILGERFELLTLSDFPSGPEVVEDADSFAGNASKKAVEVAEWVAGQVRPTAKGTFSGAFSVLADDSGLEVEGLGRAPGGHSARVAALNRMSGAAASAGNNGDLSS